MVTIYDLDCSVPEARLAVRDLFRKNGDVKDAAVRDMLVEKGYMELEETLLMWKQKAQIMRMIDGYVQQGQGHQRKFIGEVKGDDMSDFFRRS